MRNDEQQPHETQAIGRFMLYLLWIVLIALGLGWYFNQFLDERHNPNQQLQFSTDGDGSNVVVLQRNPYGHYVSNGKINGMGVQFFLDTGATDVAIPASTARRLGLRRGAAFTVSTANGSATAYRTKIDSIELGSIRLNNVRASITPSMEGDDILLGMSFLKHLEFSQKGKTLTLRQPIGAE